MLLTIDVGNTNITLGVFENETLKGSVPYDERSVPGLPMNMDSIFAVYWNTGILCRRISKM